MMRSQASAQRQRLLAGIASDLLAAEQVDAIIGSVCERVRSHLDLDVLLCHLLEETGRQHTLRLVAASGLELSTEGLEELSRADGICGAAVERCTRVLADAAHPSPESFAPAMRGLRLRAAACNPLVGPEGVLATLLFGSRTRERFTEDELWVMGAVSSLIALAVGRTQAARALEETRSRLSLANTAAGQGLWEIDLKTSHVLLSEKARELFGIVSGTERQLRTDWRPLILPEDQPAITSAIDNARAGADYQSEFRIRRPSDGRVRWILARGRVLPGTSRLVGVLADVTEARELADAQRRALAESQRTLQTLREKENLLREADRRKSEFIAILSHELRNPLAPIVYALPIIQRAPLDAQAARALGVVKRQVSHLERLVDDLLDISRINSGKVDLRREVVPLQEIVGSVVECTASLFQAGRHRLDVEAPEAALWVEADPHRLGQVLTNLLTNAARYTPRGGRIWLSAQPEGGQAVVRVRDTGIGIPADQLPRLFEMFQQIHQDESLRGGLGIGLALARRLIVMHGGTIQAFSAGAGKGTEFVVTLPLAAAPAALQPPQTAQPVHGPAPLRVLVVDDNVDLVEMLATMVTAQGHGVRKASDGPSALAVAKLYKPDVVLLDLGLPIMSGIEVARQLRADPQTREAHLVALTGWGQDEDRRRTREAGFDDHLTKPADPDTLLRVLNAFPARKR